MIRKFTFSLIFFALLSLGKALGQDDRANHKKAVELSKGAIAKLAAGELKAADSLISLSIATHPNLEIINYSTELAKLSDAVGADIVMKKLVDRTDKFPQETVFIGNPSLYSMPKERENPKLYPKNYVLFHILYWNYLINRAHGNRKQLLQAMKNLLIPKFNSGENLTETQIQKDITFQIQLLNENYVGAQEILNDPTFVAQGGAKDWYQITLNNATGNYSASLALANKLEGKLFNKYDIAIGRVFLFQTYSLMGDPRAVEYAKSSNPALYTDDGIRYTDKDNFYLAKYYIKRNEFDKALKVLNTAKEARNFYIAAPEQSTLAWDFYKAYGDVYTGLKNFTKARDNYKLAELYFPEMKSLKEAILNLETLSKAEIAADKSAPIIALIEPAPNRGVKVLTGLANVMIKGTATDVGGIKEVSVNGSKAFTQSDGNFWIDVPMKNGINKITIVAIDLAGNRAENSFDIEKALPTSTETVTTADKKGKNYCLLIASQNYEDSNIPSLTHPIADAIKLKIILKRDYGFTNEEMISLFNPSTNDIKRKLLELSQTIKPEDNLLVFYAGHGIWVDKEKKGYWLMTDAKYSDNKTWLSNNEVLDFVAKLPSRHTLLITDACFSGSVFKTRGIPSTAPAAIKELDNKISRVAITSGNDTEVPDESVFMKYLIKALSENKEKYLTAQKMFINHIIEAVMTETKTEPRYGTLESAGHIGGDFIFIKN